MALFPCRECGKQISTQAQACPHCGAPLSHSVQTIEQTGKHYKAMKLGAAALFFLGLVLLFGDHMVLGFCLIIVAAGMGASASMQSWWDHS